MGLDLTVGLHKTQEDSQANFLQIVKDKSNTNLDLDDVGIRLFDGGYFPSNEMPELSELDVKSINKYYLLNWSGVTMERKFMAIYSDFFQKTRQDLLTMRTTLKQSRTNKTKFVLVTGKKRTKIGRNKFATYDYFDVVPLKYISKGKGNFLKIKSYWKADTVSQFKIYNVDSISGYLSVLTLIALGRWEGSNGEVFVLKHNDENTISAYRETYHQSECEEEIDDDDQDTEINENNVELTEYVNEDINEDEEDDNEDGYYETTEVLKLSQNDFAVIVDEINRSYNAMKTYVEKGIKEYSYIAKNNLTLLTMMKEFLDNKDTELSSYFG